MVMKTVRHRNSRVRACTLQVLIGLLALWGTGYGADTTTPAPSPNPLLVEMRTLDSAFRNIVSAVALGEREVVRTEVASMHGSMEKTHEGIHAGTVVLPKNRDRLPEFAKQDRKFHEMLEALDSAAERNHPQEMLRITKLLLDGCVRCHHMFRK